ncbi:sigma factor-like helix-turn-helix DNA-binding protein [Clostridium sp.]|uniref:sigma factor-like helix-turn-helix DNA-binding protein n=1 Tax=Clostridium sp. TaxID=1506 RepID=UPI00257AA5A1|nr:sigma factor-like helix-turn-helix DNA-binding protein [Clostridium sp.]
MSDLQKLKDENKKLLKEINRLEKSLSVAQYWLDEHRVDELAIKANERGFKIKQLEEEIQQLKHENELLRSNRDIPNKKVHNERGAGRKAKLTNQEKEMIRMYRIQGKTIKEIAQMYSCSVGLIHKIINE